MEGNVQICFNLINENWILCKIHAKNSVWDDTCSCNENLKQTRAPYEKRTLHKILCTCFSVFKDKVSPKMHDFIARKTKERICCVLYKERRHTRNWVQVGPNKGKNKIMTCLFMQNDADNIHLNAYGKWNFLFLLTHKISLWE